MLYGSDIIRDSIPNEDTRLLGKIWKAMIYLEWVLKAKKKEGVTIPDYQCHTLARIIWILFPREVKISDGDFIGVRHTGKVDDGRPRFALCTMTHSWLKTASENIIDVYPCGIFTGGPIIVPSKPHKGSFGYGNYFESRKARKLFGPQKSLENARDLLKLTGMTLKQIREISLTSP